MLSSFHGFANGPTFTTVEQCTPHVALQPHPGCQRHFSTIEHVVYMRFFIDPPFDLLVWFPINCQHAPQIDINM